MSIPVGDTGLYARLTVTATRIESIELHWSTDEAPPPTPYTSADGIEEIVTMIRGWPASTHERVDWTSHPFFPAGGTTFQRAVWRELCTLRAGETSSYGDLATRLGRPKAARPVGQAVGCNPWALLVPCHRVLAARGKLGGYAFGAAIKSRLLENEGLAP